MYHMTVEVKHNIRSSTIFVGASFYAGLLKCVAKMLLSDYWTK